MQMDKKILIINNSTAAKENISFILAKNHYNYITAENNIEAIRKLDDQSIGLVILDLDQTIISDDFTNLTLEIEHHHLPILFLISEPYLTKTGKQVKERGWLQKPFSADNLMNNIQKYYL
jgi:DNA-binding NtrC family response regulator